MRVQDHIAKLSWTAADKMVYVLYGIVSLVQISYLTPQEYGLYTLLSTLHSYIFLVGEGFALQALIKFGTGDTRADVNRYAIISFTIIVLTLSIVVFALQKVLVTVFNEPRYTTIASFLPIYSLFTIPRLYCMKILLRDIRLKEWFIINLLWMGTMSILTFSFIATGRFNSFEDMLVISFSGVTVSSFGALWLARHNLYFQRQRHLTFKEFLRFGIYQSLFNTTNSSIKQLDALLVGAFFSTHIVGIYGSAKNLFRLFDQAFEGIIAILFPGAVRLVTQNRNEELLKFISKATSFSFFAMCLLIASIYLGFAELLITSFLPASYIAKTASAVEYFKIISLAALAMPFSVLYTLITAYGRIQLLVFFAITASSTGIIVLTTIGIYQLQQLIPLGFVVYYFVLGALCYNFVRKQIGLSPRMLLRAVPDSVQFVKELIAKRRNAS